MSADYRNQRWKVVIAPDSFKGCLESGEAAEAIRAGMLAYAPEVEADVVAMGDGGEGTASVLSGAHGGVWHECDAVNPLFSPMKSVFFEWEEDGERVCAVDVAAASGLALLRREERDARRATSYGTGMLMRSALERRPQRLILCMGGSATVDCGVGLLSALGVKFRGLIGEIAPRQGETLPLGEIRDIDCSALTELLRDTHLVMASDVTTGLLGDASGSRLGAVEIFGPQKGVSPDETALFRRDVEAFCDALKRASGRDVSLTPGGGAAGGIGASLHALTAAPIVSGVALAIRETDLRRRLEGARIVVTGEGRSDRQTLMGKVAAGVKAAADDARVRTVLMAGCVADGDELRQGGFDEIICINDGLDSGVDMLEKGVARYRLMRAGYELCLRECRKARKRYHN